MSKPKAQGTYFETWMVKWLNRIADLAGTAKRLAEGGPNDDGDIAWMDYTGQPWVGECKATQALNVTRALSKARVKSPYPDTTVLFWKRLTKSTPEAKRRTPDGEPVVVVMGLDTFHILMRDR